MVWQPCGDPTVFLPCGQAIQATTIGHVPVISAAHTATHWGEVCVPGVLGTDDLEQCEPAPSVTRCVLASWAPSEAPEAGLSCYTRVHRRAGGLRWVASQVRFHIIRDSAARETFLCEDMRLVPASARQMPLVKALADTPRQRDLLAELQ